MRNKPHTREAMKPMKLSPEEKVVLAMDMTEAVTRICADGIRDNDPKITDEELIEEIRRRITERRSE